MKKLNIGIIAHVDAGKTTLTENILFFGGVIPVRGRVDTGSTTTDSMEVERRRGISVKAAATSFFRNGVKINVIDTPGHVDFSAEVERSLSVLDGVVLVISAVEGLQSQTRILMDIIKAQGIPAVIFVNKTDRAGADAAGVVRDASLYMGGRLAVMEHASDKASEEEFIANNMDVLFPLDDEIFERYINNEIITYELFHERLASCAAKGLLYPVFHGSALRGIGVERLLDSLAVYMPCASSDNSAPVSGVVFKVLYTEDEKQAYVRVYQGTVRVREMLKFQGKEEKVTRLAVLENGRLNRADRIEAGDIGVLYFKDLRVGDIIGIPCGRVKSVSLGRPTISVEVKPVRPEQKRALYEALAILTDEDPLLDLFSDKKLIVRMFGEVQMEVLKELLEVKYGIPVVFEGTMTIYMETPAQSASACGPLNRNGTFFRAGVGLRVEPLPRGSGVEYVTEVSFGDLEKTFQNAVKDAVYNTCRNGLYGWEVTDCRVYFDYSDYDSVTSTPADFRDLTPLVLVEAFQNAGMELLEPLLEFELRVPAGSASKALFDCGRMRAEILETEAVPGDGGIRVSGLIPAGECKGYGAKTASYTEGQGVFATKFHGYRNIEFDRAKVNEDCVNPAVNKHMYLLKKSGAVT